MPEYDPPMSKFQTDIPVSKDLDMFKIMGKGGFRFKNITEQTGVKYL